MKHLTQLLLILCQNAAFWKEQQIVAYLGGVGQAKMWLLDLFGDSNPICEPHVLASLATHARRASTASFLHHRDSSRVLYSSACPLVITGAGNTGLRTRRGQDRVLLWASILPLHIA